MTRRIWLKITLITLLALTLILAVGLHFAGQTLKAQIEQALGPDSEVGSISMGLLSITITDLRIRAPAGWPAADTLRAKRIDVAPDWWALLSSKVAIRKIEIEGAYLSLLRTPQGKLRLLPSLLEQDQGKPGDKAGMETADEAKALDEPLAIRIGSINLSESTLELFDASIRKPAHKVGIEDVSARLTNLQLPDLKAESQLDLSGVIKGAQGNGTVVVRGDIELASLNSEITTTLRGIDLMALQPYLIKAADVRVKRGTLDMDIQSRIKQRRLHAPGSITLHQLVLAGKGGFMDKSRDASLGAMMDEQKRIRIQFVLEGNLDDPQFSLNESIARTIGTALTRVLGVNLGGMGEAVGDMLKGLFK